MVNVWSVSVGVGAIFSAAVPKMVASCCNAYPCRPWKVWFSFQFFWISRVGVIAIRAASSIGVSFGVVQCCG